MPTLVECKDGNSNQGDLLCVMCFIVGGEVNHCGKDMKQSGHYNVHCNVAHLNHVFIIFFLTYRSLSRLCRGPQPRNNHRRCQSCLRSIWQDIVSFKLGKNKRNLHECTESLFIEDSPITPEIYHLMKLMHQIIDGTQSNICIISQLLK